MKRKEILQSLFGALGSTPENCVSELLQRLSSEACYEDGMEFYNIYGCTTGEAQLALKDLVGKYI